MSNKYDLIKLDIDKNSWINGIVARSEKNPKTRKPPKSKLPTKKPDRLSKNLKLVLHFSLAQGTLLPVFLIQMPKKFKTIKILIV